jgi:flagellar biosynthetic protein FliS
MTPYAKASNQYLFQRVMGASQVGLVALLLEGGQRFLSQAMQALDRRDYEAKARHTNRALAIIQELTNRLDLETGGGLAQNLEGLHRWWSSEILEASMTKDAKRLELVQRQMGEIRQAWEQLDLQQRTTSTTLAIQDLVG